MAPWCVALSAAALVSGWGTASGQEAEAKLEKPNPFDRLKKIPLADRLTLDIGGSYRVRYEAQENYDLNDHTSGQSTFMVTCARLGLDFKYDKILRMFFEGQDSRITDYDTGSTVPPPKTFFENQFTIQQFYVDVKCPSPDVPVTLRVGRQNLNYGDQRLIGPFGWNNVGRVFDGAKMIYKAKKIQVDAFFVNPVSPPAGIDRVSRDEPDYSNDFFGVYAAIDVAEKHKLEPYFLVHREQDDRVRGSDGRLDDFVTKTAGARFIGGWNNWDYAVEGAYQFGKWANDKHRAFATHARCGYTFKKVLWTPRLGVEYNHASGDNSPVDSKNETFDNLFPTNHPHYGYIDFASWRNMDNVRLSASVKPVKKLSLATNYHYFRLDETADAWYSAGGVPIRRDRTGRSESGIGHEIDLIGKYALNKHVSFLAGYTRFIPDDFQSDTGTADSADFWYLQALFKF